MTATTAVLADKKGEFSSFCTYQGDGCVYRRKVKIDPERAPATNNVDRHLTPSQLFNWTGGRGTILSKTPRQGRENEWIELRGKVTAVIVEGDGDVHIELMNSNGGPAKADAEIPAGSTWCPYRQTAFGWTKVQFPIVTKRTELPLKKHPVISVIGKAFWDGQHAPGATNKNAVRQNRRTYDSACSVWEVHPVMALTVLQE